MKAFALVGLLIITVVGCSTVPVDSQTAASPRVGTQEGTSLRSSQILALLEKGGTLDWVNTWGQEVHVSLKPDRTMTGESARTSDRALGKIYGNGRWKIEGDSLCLAWDTVRWKDSCYELWNAGGKYTFYNGQGILTIGQQ